MVLRIQIAKFKFANTNWESFSPNLMLAEVTGYAYMYILNDCLLSFACKNYSSGIPLFETCVCISCEHYSDLKGKTFC